MKKLPEIIQEARRSTAEDFLRIISEASRLIALELDGLGGIKLKGRLVSLPPEGEAIVVGDIHGDLRSLEHILAGSNFIEEASKGKDVHMIFLGDYGDRGASSPEVYHVVLRLKTLFPEKVILLQGNHEGPEDLLAYPHDLPRHLQMRFKDKWRRVYLELSSLFRRFYTAVIVDGRCIMLHGGVPSMARGIDDLAYAYQKHPSESHLEEILWSDPAEDIRGVRFSPRGAGRLFGEDVTSTFIDALGVKFVIRGHEPAMDGYAVAHGGRILTLFSRKGPPYYNLHGAYLKFDLGREYNSAWRLVPHIRRF